MEGIIGPVLALLFAYFLLTTYPAHLIGGALVIGIVWFLIWFIKDQNKKEMTVRNVEEPRALAEQQITKKVNDETKERSDLSRMAAADAQDDLRVWMRAIESCIKKGDTLICINNRKYSSDFSSNNWVEYNNSKVYELDSARIFSRPFHYRTIYAQELQKLLGSTFKVMEYLVDSEIDDEGYRHDSYYQISVSWG